MVMCTNRLTVEEGIGKLQEQDRDALVASVQVFVFVFLCLYLYLCRALARLRSMAGMHWAVCRLCNFSRRPLPQPGINLSRVWYNLESTSPEAQLGQTYGATCNIQVQVAPVCLRSYRLCVRSLFLGHKRRAQKLISSKIIIIEI